MHATAAPASATPMPTTVTALGRSPPASDAVTGTSAPAEEIGATIDIGPSARAL